jgi:hypothetical protein
VLEDQLLPGDDQLRTILAICAPGQTEGSWHAIPILVTIEECPSLSTYRPFTPASWPRGGRTHARNWRARQFAAMAGPRELPTPDTPPQETTLQAMAVLDTQFGWLRGAENSVSHRRTTQLKSAPR